MQRLCTAFVALLVLMLPAGLVFGSGHAADDPPPLPTTMPEAQVVAQPISQDQAEAIAVKMYPNAQVAHTEDGLVSGIPVWEVALNNGIALIIEHASGLVQDRFLFDPAQYDLDTEIAAIVVGVPEELAEIHLPYSALEAVEIASRVYPDNAALGVDLTGEPDTLIWQVVFNNARQINIQAQTGAILQWEKVQTADGTHNALDTGTGTASTLAGGLGILGSNMVEQDRAQEIAEDMYPGTTMQTIDIQDENFVPVWDVVLDNGFTVSINALTGLTLGVYNSATEEAIPFDLFGETE